ncbi:MAG: cyclic nucleotide-binding domain-containing protein [Magnetococcales bacterium]|nr:cyclic nucleotide-binding domain-containing protein [Magnetococcales bacterium]
MDISEPTKLLLRQCKLFEGFNDEQFDQAIKCLSPRHLTIADGKPLYRRGDISDKCWIIVSGRFAIHSPGLLHPNTQQHLSYEIGEVTGLQGFIDAGSPRPVTLLAEGKLEVIEIPESGIANMNQESQIRFVNNISNILLQKIMKSRFSITNPDL